MKEEFVQLCKYGIVGVVNTLLTLGTFVALRAIGVGLDLSNLLSFVAGMVCSFLLNKFWTFNAGKGRWGREALLFFCGAGICWLVQWGAFRLILIYMPEIVAQLGGMVVYTLANFFFNKLITFKSNNKIPRGNGSNTGRS